MSVPFISLGYAACLHLPCFVFRQVFLTLWTPKITELGLSPFEQADLLRLIDLDIRNLSKIPVQGVLGYDQEYWRTPASVHVIRPEDVTLNGYLNSVEALRGVPGMHVTRGLAYDNFASMRNFSGFSTQKFLGKIGGREVSQLMLGSANYSVDDYPIAVIDRIEVIRGPGASIWGTNAVNGVLNLVTKHSGDTQGDSFRIVMQDNGTFMGDYVHGGQVSEDSFYRVWARTQEYAEGTLDSGSPARDDGYLRKAGFRYDKELESDLNFYLAVDLPRDDSSMFWICPIDCFYASLFPILQLFRQMHLKASSAVQEFVAQLSLPAVVPPIPLSVSQQLGRVLSVSPQLVALNAALPAPLRLTYDLPPPPSYAGGVWATVANGTVDFPYLSSIPLLSGMKATRFERYGEMKNDSAHVVSKIDGISDFDMEWSLTGSFDYSDINMGHLGFEWEQTQGQLSFDANLPLGDFHRISYGLSAQRTNLNVRSKMIEVFHFPGETLKPILGYDQQHTDFERYNGYVQDSISSPSADEVLLSIGAKIEENELAGFGFQPGVRASWMANDQNVFGPVTRKLTVNLLCVRDTLILPPHGSGIRPIGRAELMKVHQLSTARKWMPMNSDGAAVRPNKDLSLSFPSINTIRKTPCGPPTAPVRSMLTRQRMRKLMEASFRLTGGFRNHGVFVADILWRKEKSRVSGFMIFRKTPPAFRLISGIRIK